MRKNFEYFYDRFWATGGSRDEVLDDAGKNIETVGIHPETKNPTAAWKSMCTTQTVKRVRASPVHTPISPTSVRFVCISDTHSLTARMPCVPPGDVLLHAGDFTRCGTDAEVADFDHFLGKLQHKHKIVIAGNHEMSFDHRLGSFRTLGHPTKQLSEALDSQPKQQRLVNATYLEDSEVRVYGIKIYGTPWQPEFCNWAFNLPRGAPCLERWNLIPNDKDILLSHTPPLGHGDLCVMGVRAGCAELLSTVQKRVKPKFHVFGHIHEGYGITTDNQTVFINCSTCTSSYRPTNQAIVFDFPLPAGQKKEN